MISITSLKTKISCAVIVALLLTSFSASHAQGSSAKTNAFERYAKKMPVQLNLSWQHEKDKQVSHFILERSFDGQSFQEAALVFTSDNDDMAAYNYADRLSAMASSEVFYRLKIVDMNGSYHYSAITAIQPEQLKSGAKQIIKLQ